MENEYIFTVTTIGKVSCRTVAVCKSFERADQILADDEGALQEGTYDYAVIEETKLDVVYPETSRVWWYKWEQTGEVIYEGRYSQVSEIPDEFKNIINWGIG